MKTRLVVALALTAAVWQGVWAQEATAPKAVEKPRVEAVFVLDTTGSMSGLIQAAKEKIWAIANSLATAEPTPDIKMGLVAYRDRGDAYVTLVTDLSDDLDAVYAQLMLFQAQGGGDGPESVNQALHEAVTKIRWSADEKVYRIIFLVGDYPPHMDYDDDVKYPVSCKLAAEKGIVINTIQCGGHGPTEPIWREIASKADGSYFRVEQSGGAVLASTPHDADLARLARELDATRVFYGRAEDRARANRREAVAGAIYERATVEAQARRAAFNAGEAGMRNLLGGRELAQDVADGQVKLADVSADELPEAMQKMTPEERDKFLAENLARRANIQKQIAALAAQRQAFIEEQIKEGKLKAEGSLDHAIYKAVKTQAAEAADLGLKGVAY